MVRCCLLTVPSVGHSNREGANGWGPTIDPTPGFGKPARDGAARAGTSDKKKNYINLDDTLRPTYSRCAECSVRYGRSPSGAD